MRDGYYWVKIKSHHPWEVARAVDGVLYCTGMLLQMTRMDFAAIGPRLPEPTAHLTN